MSPVGRISSRVPTGRFSGVFPRLRRLRLKPSGEIHRAGGSLFLGVVSGLMPDADDRFDLGILFVHGIGEQAKGDTLRQFGEPMYRWIREWLNLSSTAETRASLRHVYLDGRGGPELPTLPKEMSDGESPANAQIQLTRGSRSRTRWLITETHWAEDFAPPTVVQVARWTFGVIPWLALTQGVDALYGAEAHQRGGLIQRWVRRALDSLSATVLLAVALPAAVVMEVVGIILIILALVPQLQRFVGGVQRLLGRSVGDSYTLLTSPMSLTSMITRIQGDLGWVCKRAKTVVIVAHSQGAALAHRALRQEHPANVIRLITVGQAVGKLEALDFVGSSMRLALWTSLLAGTFALGFSVLFFWLLPALASAQPAWIGSVLTAASVATWIGILRFLALSLGFSLRGLNEKHRDHLRLGQSIPRFEWHDLYGSVDPVSNGPMFHEAEAGYVPKPIRNSANILRDHTQYLQNRDTFWPAVMSALPLSAPWARVLRPQPSLESAAERRKAVRVTSLVAARVVAVATFVCVGWWSMPYWSSRGNVDEWCWSGLRALLKNIPDWLGNPPAAALFKGSSDCVRIPAWMLVAPAVYLAIHLSWRWWDNEAVRAFLARKTRSAQEGVFVSLFAASVASGLAGLALVSFAIYSPVRPLPTAVGFLAGATFVVMGLITYWRPYEAYRRFWLGPSRPEDKDKGAQISPAEVFPFVILSFAVLFFDRPVAAVLAGAFFTALNLTIWNRPKLPLPNIDGKRGDYELENSRGMGVLQFVGFSILPGWFTRPWFALVPVLAVLFVLVFVGRRNDPGNWIPQAVAPRAEGIVPP
jgi:hypothetical protein